MKKLIVISLSLFIVIAACVHASAYSELHMVDNMHARRQPDVLADLLTRTSQTGPLPVLLIVRHTNIYPSVLKKVTMTAQFGDGETIEKIIDYNKKLKRVMWHDVQYVDLPDDFVGDVSIDVVFEIEMKKKTVKIKNNNRRKSKRLPLKVTVGAPALPRFDNWHYGDAHFHSLFSENQAEFGAPVYYSALMADMFGMDWLVFTDHSFDLDDMEGDSVTNDPDLARWERYKKEINDAAEKHKRMLVVAGEELSCGNSTGQNVHMIVYNQKTLYVGNGDGYEGDNIPDSPCAQVTADMPGSETGFAAHPITEINSVEMYVINRGVWSLEDMKAPGLTGLQAWNRSRSPLPEGFEAWKQVLLDGHRKYLLGGTDAHGDFNYEFGGWPEGFSFGGIRSAVYAEGELTIEKLIESLRAGKVVVTSGPLATLELMNGAGDTAGMGEDIGGGPMMAVPKVKSSPEFGPIGEIRVIVGDLENKTEKVIATYNGKYASDPMNMEETVILPEDVKNGYVRVEAFSTRDDLKYEAYTNPIWFEM